MPESGYCLGEMVTFLCSQRVGTINGVTYDTLEWTVAANHSVGRVIFIAEVHQPGTTRSLSFMDEMFEATVTMVNSTVMQSTLMVVVSAPLNGSVIRCAGGGIQTTTPAISVTSEYHSLHC